MPTYKEEYRKRVEGIKPFDWEGAGKRFSAGLLGAGADTLIVLSYAAYLGDKISLDQLYQDMDDLQPYSTEGLSSKFGAPEEGLESYADWLTLGLGGVPGIIRKSLKRPIRNIIEKKSKGTLVTTGDKSYDAYTKEVVQDPKVQDSLKTLKKDSVPVVFQKSTYRRGNKPDGDLIMAYFDRKQKKIFIDPELAEKKYNEKAWLKPKVPGVKPLPEDSFATYKDWERFLVEHEQAHTRLPQLKDEAYHAYENRMNDEAFNVIGKRNKYKKKT